MAVPLAGFRSEVGWEVREAGKEVEPAGRVMVLAVLLTGFQAGAGLGEAQPRWARFCDGEGAPAVRNRL